MKIFKLFDRSECCALAAIATIVAAVAVSGCGNNVKNARAQAGESVGRVIDECGVVQLVDTTKKTVYLVFTAEVSQNDNGWFENFDGVFPVLDTLADRGVKGSFFPTGNCFRAEKYADAIRRIISEGHYLSHHSDHHLHLCTEDAERKTLVSMDSLKVDISGVEAELRKFGLEPEQYPWMIPPYEEYNAETAANLMQLGYKLVNPSRGLVTGSDWMGEDAGHYVSARQLVRNIWDYENSHSYGLNGAVILVHAMSYPCRRDDDRMWWYLGEVIDGLRERGYDFGTFADVE